MNAEIEAITRGRTSSEWITTLNDAGVPAGPINSIDQVFADPQVQHLEMAAPVHHPELGDIELVSQAVKMHDTPFVVRSATPALGEHTDEILLAAGYTDDDITGLREAGAI